MVNLKEVLLIENELILLLMIEINEIFDDVVDMDILQEESSLLGM